MGKRQKICSGCGDVYRHKKGMFTCSRCDRSRKRSSIFAVKSIVKAKVPFSKTISKRISRIKMRCDEKW